MWLKNVVGKVEMLENIELESQVAKFLNALGNVYWNSSTTVGIF